jgi:hypothetical protein
VAVNTKETKVANHQTLVIGADPAHVDSDERIEAILPLRSEHARLGRQDPAALPSFVIVHRFWEEGSVCLPGEEIFGVWFEPDGPQLRLTLTLLLVFDDFVKHHWVAQSAAQIEASMRNDPFYVRHAANSRTSTKLTRRISRSGIKTYVARIREAMQLAFDEAGVDLNAAEVLVSEPTVGNEVRYRLRAKVRVVHLP